MNVQPTPEARKAPRRARWLVVAFLGTAGLGVATLAPALAGPAPGPAVQVTGDTPAVPVPPVETVVEVAKTTATTTPVATVAAATTAPVTPSPGPEAPIPAVDVPQAPAPVEPEPLPSTTTTQPLSLQGHYDCLGMEQDAQYDVDCVRDVAVEPEGPDRFQNPFDPEAAAPDGAEVEAAINE